MKNIFENAYFGKAYKTRDGRKAIYLWTNKKEGHSLIIEGDSTKKPHHFDINGKWYAQSKETPYDIVSEWKPEIDEEELDNLAMDASLKFPLLNPKEGKGVAFYKGYKAGYLKAKQE